MRYKHTCTSFFFCLWCLPQDRLLNLGVPLYRSDGPQKTRKMHCSFRLLANSPVHQHNSTEVPPVDRTTCAMHLQEITISFSNALVVIKAKFFVEFLEINRLFYKVPNILLLNSHTGDISLLLVLLQDSCMQHELIDLELFLSSITKSITFLNRNNLLSLLSCSQFSHKFAKSRLLYAPRFLTVRVSHYISVHWMRIIYENQFVNYRFNL